jgi:subtilisin family serine protease
VAAAVASGVSYHSSAGNEAESHVEQDFLPIGDGNGAHDFAAGGKDAFDAMIVPAGATLTCILQWNDPFGASANDYDLALLDGDLNVVALSTDPQSGTQDPIEIVSVRNATNANQPASIVIPRFSGEPRRLEVFCLGALGLEHGTAEGSIVGHPALAAVVAVGAMDVLDPGLDDVEPFSSQGPARIDFPAPETRAKPDLVAFDGVAISNAGGFPACPPSCAFFGTSAAAPHTAGVAALLLSANPSLSPAEIQAALTNGAVDIGPTGFDDASGFGRLDAVAASEAIVQNPPNDPPDDPGDPCASDDECADDDPCTTDVCDPERGCVSTPPEGTDGLSCLLDRISEPDACDANELDAKTLAFVAKRLDGAEALLAKAERATRPAARATALRKLARKLQAIRKRLDRLDPDVVSDECAESLAALLDQAELLTRALRL